MTPVDSGFGQRRGRTIVLLAAVGLALGAPRVCDAWGLGAHRWLARHAAELASDRCPALVRAADDLERFAVEPDTVLKARDGRRETIRHFLDLDAYGLPPFRALPRSHDEAVRRFDARTIDENGILPWAGADLAQRLAAALAGGDLETARRLAGHLAHYAGDATMPLHATKNHDGQLTGQRGLHARVEARLVDARLTTYTRAAAGVPARRPIAPAGAAGALFAALEASYADVDAVLDGDRVARRGTRVGSALYFRRLDRELGARLAARLGGAAVLTAALWEGACIAAER